MMGINFASNFIRRRAEECSVDQTEQSTVRSSARGGDDRPATAAATVLHGFLKSFFFKGGRLNYNKHTIFR